MECGTILYDEAFQFSDGPEARKLAIVLSEYGTNHLIVKTTSQIHAKGTTPGCQINDNPPNYFLPENTCWFSKDTWVELDEVFELASYIHKAKTQDGTTIEQSEKLDLDLMKKIIDCALESELIDEFYVEHLQRVRAKM